jgi:hypothetical protein
LQFHCVPVVLLAACGRGDADPGAATAVGETTNKACAVFSAGELSDVLGVRVGQPISTWPSCAWQTDAADLLAFATVIDTIPNMAATAAVRAGTAWGWLPGGYLRVITSTREHTIQLLRLAVQRFPDL